jgi:cupin fold WbuC family metalloprotein
MGRTEMKTRTQNPEVLISKDPLGLLNKADLIKLKKLASKNPRKRIRICTHSSPNDKFHEMFIVMSKDSYVRPHKHLKKTESLHIIEGRADSVFFDNKGNVVKVVKLGDYASGRVMYYRLGRPQFHMLIVRSAYLVFHEATTGPFDRAQTILASWAPEDYDKTEIQKFLAKVEKQIR